MAPFELSAHAFNDFLVILNLALFIPQAFRPLVGKAVLGSIAAVEFFADRQLDFLTDDDAYQPYQVGRPAAATRDAALYCGAC